MEIVVAYACHTAPDIFVSNAGCTPLVPVVEHILKRGYLCLTGSLQDDGYLPLVPVVKHILKGGYLCFPGQS